MRTLCNQSRYHSLGYFIITASLAILTGCGSSGVAEKDVPPMAQADNQTPVTPPGLPAGYAPYNYFFTTCGKEPKTVSGLVQTDNLLNLRVKAESAPQNGCYTDANKIVPYQARYTCARFKVTMQVKMGATAHDPTDAPGDQWTNRATFITDPLASPGTQGCTGSKPEVTYNLSNHLFAGHGLVRFQIESVETNHFCNYYNYCRQNMFSYDCAWARTLSSQSVCPFKPVYQYHKTAGQIEVQTDGTVF